MADDTTSTYAICLENYFKAKPLKEITDARKVLHPLLCFPGRRTEKPHVQDGLSVSREKGKFLSTRGSGDEEPTGDQ